MNASVFFSTLFAAIKSGFLSTIIPDLLTFIENTKGLNLLSVTDRLTYAAQLDLLRATAMTQLPNLAVTDLQQLNTSVLTAALPKASTSATTVSTAKTG
jgi:hypothetical protein